MVPGRIVIDNDYATLQFHPDTKIVHHEWHTFVHGEVFRDVMSTGAELLKQNGGTKWLSDDRGNSALPVDDERWVNTVWMPAVLAAGWKHWALVMPTKVIGQMNMRNALTQIRAAGLNAEVFDDPEKGYVWLAAQK